MNIPATLIQANRGHVVVFVVLVALLVASAVPAVSAQPVELIENGSFETGDFSGWTAVATGTPFIPWGVSGAGVGGDFGMEPTEPQDGDFVAWNGFDGNGPMEFQLWQDVSLPADHDVMLSWMERIQWDFTTVGTASLPRIHTVEIRSSADGSIQATVHEFSTGTQDEHPTGNTGWQEFSIDLTEFSGQDVRIMFRQRIPEVSTGPGQFEIDAIRLLAEQEEDPEPPVDPDPVDKDECKKGGWQEFGFRNQGQCIRFVNTGQDSR